MRRVGVRSAVIGVVFAMGLSTAACSGTSFLKSGDAGGSKTPTKPSQAAFTGRVDFNVPESATNINISTVLKVTAAKASLQSVTVTGPSGPVPGTLASNGVSWTASGLLQPS